MIIKNILIPTDFSENAQVAFECAHDLAHQLGAKLFLLHVRDESTLRVAVKEGLLHPDSTDEELQANVQQLIQARFSQMVAGLAHSDVLIEQLALRGEATAAIVDCASDIRADLLVIGMRGITAMNTIVSAVLGSVTESVARKSPCPVLIVRPEHRH